jgi:hypothetical protein
MFPRIATALEPAQPLTVKQVRPTEVGGNIRGTEQFDRVSEKFLGVGFVGNQCLASLVDSAKPRRSTRVGHCSNGPRCAYGVRSVSATCRGLHILGQLKVGDLEERILNHRAQAQIRVTVMAFCDFPNPERSLRRRGDAAESHRSSDLGKELYMIGGGSRPREV